MVKFPRLHATIRPSNTHTNFPIKGGNVMAHFQPNMFLTNECKFLNLQIISPVSQTMQLETGTLWTFWLSVHGTPCWQRSVNFLKKPQKQVGKFLLLIKILGARGCGDILAAITDEILSGETNSKTAYVTTFWCCKIHHQGLQEHSVAGFHFFAKLSSYCFLHFLGHRINKPQLTSPTANMLADPSSRAV